MDNMLIKWRLLLMGSITGLFFLLVAAVGTYSANQGAGALTEMYENHVQSLNILSRIGELVRDNRTQLLLAIQHDSANPVSRMHDHPLSVHTDQVDQNIARVTALWQEFLALPGMTGEKKKLADSFSEARGRYVSEGLIPTRQLVLAGDFTAAQRLILQKINPLAKETFASLDAMLSFEDSVSKESYKNATRHLHKSKLLVLGTIFIAMFIGTFINLAVIRSVTRGVKILTQAANRMAGGDLSSDVPLSSRDEMGQLAASFNTMRASLLSLIARVAQDASRVAATATQVYATSEQMASSADQTAAQAGSVATASEEMAATSGEIAQTCQIAANGSSQANQVARDGARVVAQTVAVMGRVSERVQESARTVESLGVRSDQIGAIVGTIEDIADQTNLLALNAAIEAARAGEQGRGFAVVADEVRALAERTTRATREIGQMIKSIQAETRSAVSAMNDGVAEVAAGSVEAARSGEALQEILDRIDGLTMQVSQIATAAEQQTATTSEITANIQLITDVVQETARGAKDSVAAASELNSLAVELQQLVRQFRLA